MVIDDTGSVEDIHAFIYCKKWRFGRVSRMPDRQTTLKDRATQLLIKYKSGALVTQLTRGDSPGDLYLRKFSSLFCLLVSSLDPFTWRSRLNSRFNDVYELLDIT